MFRWLHLSDIHVGMTDQGWLWPTLKHAVFDDFDRLFSKTKSVNVLIFSGDFTQRGTASEFSRFTAALNEIRERLGKYGPIPPLLAVPGNHDLQRPPQGSLFEAGMRQVPEDDLILRQIFELQSEQRDSINGVFAEYSKWQDELIATGVHLAPAGRGPLAGDLTFEVPFDGGVAGIAVLNSAWLQLAGGDYQGRLHVDPRQLSEATGNDAEAWTRGHDINLIVTHHPVDWLHPKSLVGWQAEIAPAGRFDAHLFGHMHEHAGRATTLGGSAPTRQLQAASVFGLEMIDGKQQRSHGYSIAEINLQPVRQIKVWPRVARKMPGGERRLVPDTDQGLDEDNSFSWPLDRTGGVQAPPLVSMDEASRVDAQTATHIDKMCYHLATARAHLAVRRIERTEATAALDQSRVVWISHDWGLGEDGFLWSLLAKDGDIDRPVFRLDLQNYTTREAFLNDIRAELGFSFEQLLEHLATVQPAVLLLDNFLPESARVPGAVPPERELEDMADIVREFADGCIVVLRGRPHVDAVRKPVVELRPFEEPDVADYVRAHEMGGETYAGSSTVAKLWQHTGGSPVRLDTILRDLEVTSLDDLLNSAGEYLDEIAGSGVPATLAGTLRDMKQSEAPVLERSYQLLEALTALPRGEQFKRIRRFLGVHPFHQNHARELASRGLIETVPIAGMAAGDAGTDAKTLVVPRIVLDAVRKSMTPEERRRIDGKAVDLYFGPDWRSGAIVNSPAGKRCADPLCEQYEVINASMLVEKLIVQARDEGDDLKLEAAIRLTSAFVEVLIDGDHFQSAAQLCERVLPLIPIEGNEPRIDILRYALGRSIRMIERVDEARDVFRSIDRSNLSKEQRRQVDLHMALIAERLGDPLEAANWARAVIKGGKSDGPAIQAQAILAEQLEDRAERMRELARLEVRARKIKATVAANNIALSRAGLEADAELASQHLNRAVESAEADKDFYNGARAIVRLMRRSNAQGGNRGPEQVARLIRAYQHLHNERGSAFFDQSHDALWRVFKENKDWPNLFRLFRHSSLIWRLRAQEMREDPFIVELAKYADRATGRELARELAYYHARAAAKRERQEAGRPALPPAN